MKNYRLSVLLFNKKGGKHLFTKYFEGLQATRNFVPVKLHYCRNASAFVGYYDDEKRGTIEFWAVAV